MNTKKFLAPVLGVVAIAVFLAVRPVSAITLIPPSMEFSVKPGETVATQVKLFNETASAIEQYSSLANFKAKDETGTPAFAPESDVSDLASWIMIDKGPFVLQPGDRLEIPVTIKIPEDAEPGGHYAGIFFSSQVPEAINEGGVGISSKIGALVLIRVAGVISESGTVAGFTTADGKTLYNRRPISLFLRMQNSGNVHIRPAGKVTIRNIIGGTSAELTLNPSQGAVLPGQTRRFDLSWEREADMNEKGNFFQEIGREWHNFGFGAYTANLSLTYGQANDKSATASFNFWILPWRILTLSIIVIGLFIWLIIFFVKRYNRWIVQRAKTKSKS